MERSSGAAPPRQSGESEHETDELLALEVEDSTDGVAIVSLRGELDLSTIPRVEPRLLETLRERDSVIVDLSALRFIDSSGIGMLIGAFKRAGNGRGMLTVVTTGTQVERVLRLSGVDRVLPVFVSREEALASLADPERG